VNLRFSSQIHCSVLAEDAIKGCHRNWKNKKGIAVPVAKRPA